MTTSDRVEVLCTATASSCVCDRPLNHDEELPHACVCGGQWLGEWDTDSFVPVEFPRALAL